MRLRSAPQITPRRDRFYSVIPQGPKAQPGRHEPCYGTDDGDFSGPACQLIWRGFSSYTPAPSEAHASGPLRRRGHSTAIPVTTLMFWSNIRG
jgi:hypothetical protein